MEKENKLISPWGYIGYSILFSIPLIGLILVFVFSFSSKYPCRKNYARCFLICFVIIAIAFAVLYFCGFNYVDWFNKFSEAAKQTFV